MTRELAKKEGIFVGNSAGCAVQGLLQLKDQLKPDDLVVVIFHDHGSRYVGKIFNDDWMRDRGFLDKGLTRVREVNGVAKTLLKASADDIVNDVARMITDNDISQLPIFEGGEPVGSITESKLFSTLFSNPEMKSRPVSEIMQEPLPIVKGDQPISEVINKLDKKTPAVLYLDSADNYRILTKHDIIRALSD